MIGIVGLGVGAGLVSALLFALVVTGSSAGLLLCYFAPIPIAIVALGWHHLVGLLAVAVGGLTISLALSSNAALAYAVSAALPAWGLAYLVLLDRSVGRTGPERSLTGWLSVGSLLAWTAAVAAAIAFTSTVALGRGNYTAFEDMLSTLTEAVLRNQLGVPSGQPIPSIAGVPGSSFVLVLVDIAPAIASAVFTVVTVLNLWVAGRVVMTSGRLPRPWFALWTARMPPQTLAGLGAGVLMSLAPGWPGVIGATIVGAAVMAYALEGLALVHAATRGRPGRNGLLALLYMLLALFGGFVLPLLTLAGVVDCATPLRHRLSQPTSPSGGPPPSRGV